MNSSVENDDGNKMTLYSEDNCNSKFRLNGDILDHLEKEKPVDHLMSSEQYETHHVPFLEEDCAYARPLCTEEMLQHLEKDMEQRIAEEVEDHRTRIFGIISDFRNNLGCAFEQNVPEAGSLTPLNVENERSFGELPLNGYNIEDESFQNASFSSSHTMENGIVESSPADIEFSIDRQLLAVVSNCFKICKRLEGFSP
ncbi:uncharacterized protein LOC135685302 [Rhopilema esculentum]|uniref:uncharacterized protein LOC135685302 n=1 Tax=Rhopilema esculentum TaxID=499914 RepID=UPI0031DA2C01